MTGFSQSQILNYFRLSQSAYLYSCGDFKDMKGGGRKFFSEPFLFVWISDFQYFRQFVADVNFKCFNSTKMTEIHQTHETPS